MWTFFVPVFGLYSLLPLVASTFSDLLPIPVVVSSNDSHLQINKFTYASSNITLDRAVIYFCFDNLIYPTFCSLLFERILIEYSSYITDDELDSIIDRIFQFHKKNVSDIQKISARKRVFEHQIKQMNSKDSLYVRDINLRIHDDDPTHDIYYYYPLQQYENIINNNSYNYDNNNQSNYRLLEYHLSDFCESYQLIKEHCLLVLEHSLKLLVNLTVEPERFLVYTPQSGSRNEISIISEHKNLFISFFIPSLYKNINGTQINYYDNIDDELEEINYDNLIYNYYITQIHTYQHQNSNHKYFNNIKNYPNNNTMKNTYSRLNNNIYVMDRVCFIHSCTLQERNFDILYKILNKLKSSKLLSDLSMCIVLNYGVNILTNISLQLEFPTVYFIQRSSDVSKYEVPTLRHIHHFSKRHHELQLQLHQDNKWNNITTDNNNNSNDIQILYLHTKGVSFTIPSKPISDWVDMMLYFTVEKHMKCYYLLLSQVIDTVGCSFLSYQFEKKNTTYRLYAGNMWWGLSSYISTLPEAIGSKYDAERYVCMYVCMYVIRFKKYDIINFHNK